MSHKKHKDENHPAVGVLECALGYQAGIEPGGRELTYQQRTGDSGVCMHCGFDEDWHKLKVSDFTGDARPPEWEERARPKSATKAKPTSPVN